MASGLKALNLSIRQNFSGDAHDTCARKAPKCGKPHDAFVRNTQSISQSERLETLHVPRNQGRSPNACFRQMQLWTAR